VALLNARYAELLLERGIRNADEKFFASIVHTDEDVEATLAGFASAGTAPVREYAGER
jgi:hypothetical protein